VQEFKKAIQVGSPFFMVKILIIFLEYYVSIEVGVSYLGRIVE
jgi:hypothetical protein